MKTNHWRREKDIDGNIWLHFDMVDSGANVLSSAVLDELDTHIQAIADEPPSALILLSDKDDGFAAGADVKEFTRLQSAEAAQTHMQRVHAIFDRLEGLTCPTLALIRGYCLGGGLELALACRYRIAADDPSTRLGLPEVRLGIFPGFGGTVRANKLIGPLNAMSLMLGGHTLSGKAAKNMGLVDLTVPERQLHAAASWLLSQQAKPHRPAWHHRILNNALIRPVLARQFKRRLLARIKPEHYPAPFTLIEHWQRFAARPAEMYANETKRVAQLIAGPNAQNLIRVFLLQERLKSLAKGCNFRPRHAHIVGGGRMGGDIAAWCALQGLTATLQDRAPAYLQQAIKRAYALFRKRLRNPVHAQAAADRLIPDHKGYGIKKADVVIEAIFEDVDAKHHLFRELEPQLSPDTLLASNTSSITLEVLSTALTRPERLVGLHFFNPVAKMKLVEIITSEQTDPETAARAIAFARRIDRLPLPVKSSPGFLVNRILMPYLIEAIELMEEAVPPGAIDQAAIDFGMPMGPVELADSVGLDICLAVADKLATHFPIRPPERLRKLVTQNKLGRKSGQGFYRYVDNKPKKKALPKSYQPPVDLTERLIFRLLNESVACLREGFVMDADLLDAGVVFGTGFAPFRGGPMHYIQSGGLARMRRRLHALERDHGSQFSEDAGWTKLGA